MDLRLFLTILAAAFILMKVSGVIAWSWWLVLIPLYPAFFLLGIAVLAWTTFVVVWLIQSKEQSQRARTAREVRGIARLLRAGRA